MTDVETRSLVPGSLGSVALVAGFVTASHLFLDDPMPSSVEEYGRAAPLIDYNLSPTSYGEYAYIFAPTRLAAISSAEPELQNFYADLMAKQERLGTEFEKALFENLWTLYAR
jgi:hypothetical protein